MNLDADLLRTLSGLLDHALDLDAPGRERWLEELGGEHAALKPLLREMFSANAAETRDILATLPWFDLAAADAGTPLSRLEPGLTVGPYTLVRELGRGGMGEVWLAERSDGLLRRPVALKLPHVAASQRTLAERFAREREILAPLNHPHIARLYDAGFADDGQPYLALEYVEGVPITTYCDAQRLDLAARIGLFLQVLRAVQYAHANLVLHRDLKPSNIMVTPEGEVKLLDFGIAKLMADGNTQETELTRLGGQALTLDYASPEQITGAPLTTASDVYALGVVLYELLSGERPYRLRRGTRGELEDAIVDAHVSVPSRGRLTGAAAAARGVSLARLKRQLAGDLDTIALKAIRKAPQQRYANPSELAGDLERHLGGLPVLARPDSRWYRARRFVRRNALAVGAAMAIALTLMIATVVSLLLMQRAERAAIEARREGARALAVQEFVSDLFRANSSSQRAANEARNMTARQLLDRGVERLGSLSQGAPDAQASLLRLFGELYEDLGLNDKASALHAQSVEAARRVYGRASREAALALLEQAWVLRKLDLDDPRPLELTLEAKSILATIAPRSEDHAQALYMEAHFAIDAARAIRAAEASVEIMRSLGSRSRRAAFAFKELGKAQLAHGQYQAATTSLNESLVIFHALYGGEIAEMADIDDALADSLRAQLRLPEAEAAQRDAIAIAGRTAGDVDVSTPYLRLKLSRILFARGKPGEARAELEAFLRADPKPINELTLAALEIAQGDVARGLAHIATLSALLPPAGNATAMATELQARAHLMSADFTAARADIDRGKPLRQGKLSLFRKLALDLLEAEIQAAEGDSEGALRALERVEAAYVKENSALDTQFELAVARARILASTREATGVREALAPWLGRSPLPGVELPVPVRAEALLLAGEAAANEHRPDARGMLIEALTLLKQTNVASSPRLSRAERALAAL